MLPIIILSACVLVPLILALVLRSDGASMFLSVCLGAVLAMFVAVDVADALTGFTPIDELGLIQWVRLGLIILPLFLTILCTRKAISKSGQLINFFPALITGVLLAILTVDYLPANIQDEILANDAWDTLFNLQTAILLAGSVFALVSLLFRPRPATPDKKAK